MDVFSKFSKSNVLVVGDIILDRYWSGLTNKISPESPVPIVNIKEVINKPGGAANVAMNIAALGGKSKLVGFVGIDEASEILKKQLTKSKIEWDLIAINTHPTIIKLRIISRNQQLIRLDFEKNFNNVNTNQLIEQVKLNIPQCNVLVLSDYAKGSLDHVEEIIEFARHFKIPIIIDPKGARFFRYKGATLLTPNISEFEEVVGYCHDDSVLIKRAREIILDCDLSALLITRAERGMILLRLNSDPIYFSNQAKEVYDVTGAGDTVVGVLSAALSSGENLERSCFLANLAAGAVVGKIGTSTIDIIEMENIIQNYECSHIPFGILDKETLKRAVSLVRNKGEKIVMTNGVFDILHYGHISCLNDAKKIGDKLIVAVNSDKSTRRLKGKRRPLHSLEKRMFVLSALSVVDWVISFEEDTPVQLIKEIAPDFLVKGGDYQFHEIDGNQEVRNMGGKVLVLDFKSGYSTSKIIRYLEDD